MLTLSGLKSRLAERGHASLDELALHFDADREAVRAALVQLETRGRVAKHQARRSCSGCAGHACVSSEVWEWRDRETPPSPGCRDR